MKKILLLLFLFPALSHAGAWVQKKGEYINIIFGRYYHDDKYWNGANTLRTSPTYQEDLVYDYFEFGATNNLTLGAQVSGLHIDSPGDGIVTGLGDVTFLARYKLFEAPYKFISTQWLVNIPGHAAKFVQSNRGSATDIEGSLIFGYSGQFKTSSWFADFQPAVRYRTGVPASQFRFNWDFGWKFKNETLWFFWQQFNTISFRDEGNPTASDYDDFVISPSIVWWFKKNAAFQFGISQDVFGRNTGMGTAPFISLWVT